MKYNDNKMISQLQLLPTSSSIGIVFFTTTIILLSSSSSSSLVSASIDIEGADKFQQCFCYNHTASAMCHPNWKFFNVTPCVDWFITTLAWLISIFIISNIFFVSICFCCCSASLTSGCWCGAGSQFSAARSRRIKAYFSFSFFFLCLCMAGLIFTSEMWAGSSGKAVTSSKQLVQQITDLLKNSASSVTSLHSYSSQPAAVKYSLTPSFVTTAELALAEVDETASSDTQSVINEVFPIIKKYLTRDGSPYSRAAIITYLCGASFLTLLLIFVFMCGNRREHSIGIPASFFSLFSYLLCGFFISSGVSVWMITSDICSVYDTTFVPAMKNLAASVDACQRDYVVSASSNSLNGFANFVFDNRLSAAFPCSDIRLLDPSAVPYYGCQVEFQKSNYTSYTAEIFNISSFGAALGNLRIEGVHNKKEMMDLTHCLSDPSSVGPAKHQACSRLSLFKTLVYDPVEYLSYTATPETQNCNVVTNGLTSTVHPALCGDFQSSVRDFSIAGGCYLIVALFTLLFIRWGVKHFRTPEEDEDMMTTRSSTSRKFTRVNVMPNDMQYSSSTSSPTNYQRRNNNKNHYVASDIESLHSYSDLNQVGEDGGRAASPPDENSYYRQYYDNNATEDDM